MILTHPIVSQAIIFFTSAFSLDILIIFSASETATIVGSPSGTAATIRTILVINASDTVSRFNCPFITNWITSMAKTMAAAEVPSTVICFPSLSSFSWSGVVVFSIEESSCAIWPNSVLLPTPVTSIWPFPADTKQPEYSIFARSATGVVSWQTTPESLFTGRLSPVSADSSTVSSLLSRSRPSATILSPVSTMTISPTTISFWVTSCGSPLRMTLISVSSLILFNASNALALFPSVMIVITTESAMAAKIPTHSRKLYSPPVK